MKLIRVAITLATASVAMAQEPPVSPSGAQPMPSAPPGSPSAPPPEVPSAAPSAVPPPAPPADEDPPCWYQRQADGQWINVCSKPAPSYSQTVVPPPYTSTSTPTPTTYKTHPHQWHQRPQPRPTWTASDVPIWW